MRSWVLTKRTVQDLKGHQAVVLPMIGQFGGRIIDMRAMASSLSSTASRMPVECAVAIQDTMRRRNAAIEAIGKCSTG